MATKLINSELVALDNVDSPINWLPELLAVAATSGTLSLRKYYTTADVEYRKLNCQLILTARTPALRNRDDVASRLVIFKLKQFENFESGDMLIKTVLNNRNAMLSAIVNQLNKMIKTMREHFGSKLPEVDSKMRLQDYASLICLYIASNVVSRGGSISYAERVAKRIYECIIAEQNGFLVESDSTIDMIVEYLNEHQEYFHKEVSASEFYRAIKNHAIANKIKLSIEAPAWLSRRLIEKSAALELMHNIEFRSQRKAAGVFYRFKKLRNEADECNVLLSTLFPAR